MDGIDLSPEKRKLQFPNLPQCAALTFYFCACSCARFFPLPVLLSLPRQIPAVIPSTQRKELPTRLCWTLQRLIYATAPPLPHQLLGTASLPRSAGSCKERSPAAKHHGSTHRAQQVTRGPNSPNYWNKTGTADPQTALLLFNLFFPPATQQCIFFFPFSIRLFFLSCWALFQTFSGPCCASLISIWVTTECVCGLQCIHTYLQT